LQAQKRNQTSIPISEGSEIRGKEKRIGRLPCLFHERKAQSRSHKRQVGSTVKIETKNSMNPKELRFVANVKEVNTHGRVLVFSAHIQETCANDNANGSGAQLEMQRSTGDLIQMEN